MTDAHAAKQTHSYVVTYPDHEPRETDAHFVDFHHLRKVWAADPDKWQCAEGKRRNDFSECDLTHPLELHHSHIEFALQNAVDLKWLEVDYPGVSNRDVLGAWTESAPNLEPLCRRHHRSHAGKHSASVSDFEAARYVRGLIT